MKIKFGRVFVFVAFLGIGALVHGQNVGVFKRFYAVSHPDFVVLEWELEEGSQCYDMRVERSVDSLHFDLVEMIPGFCGGNTLFSFRDSTPVPFRKTYYRLVSAAMDRSDIISPSSRNSGNAAIFVFPNPVRESAEIVFRAENAGEYVLQVYSTSGQLLLETNKKNGNVFLFEKKGLEAGIYLLKIFSAGASPYIGRLVVVD